MKIRAHLVLNTSLSFAVIILLANCASSPQAQLSFISQSTEDKYGFYQMDSDGGNAEVVFLQANNIGYLQWSPDGKHIIVRYKDKGEYYLRALEVDAEGVCLTCAVDDYASPVFSPAGDKTAFGAQPGLYAMDSEGSEIKQISSVPEPLGISWSPDGKFLAFVAGTAPVKWHNIYRVDADGSNLINLTQGAQESILRFGVEWSPDGERLVFFSQEPTGLHLMVMNSDGSGLTRVAGWETTSEAEDSGHLERWPKPKWSADGRQIAFLSAAADNSLDVFVVNADGSDLRNVSNQAGSESNLVWSPDGQQLLFETAPLQDGPDLAIANADGAGMKNLTNHRGADRDPVWSPDGRQIAFRTNRDGNWEIYVMNADGSQPVNVSNSPDTDEFDPGWRSRPAGAP